MSTLIDADKLLQVIREIGSNELLTPDEIAELIERQPTFCGCSYKDGYIRALKVERPTKNGALFNKSIESS